MAIDSSARELVPTWHLVEELRLGTIDEPGPESFGDARALAVDDSGRIYVLEAQAQEVRVFSRGGVHLRTVGRKGAGPGEFRRANGIESAPGTDPYVYDYGNQRLTLIAADADSVAMYPLASTSFGYVWDARVDTAGRVHEGLRVAGREGSFVRRFDPATQRADTFAVAVDRQSTSIRLGSEGRPSAFVTPRFSPGWRRRFDQTGGMWVAWTADYELQQRSVETGDTLRIVEFSAPAIPVTEEERARAIAWIDSIAERYGGSWDRSLLSTVKPAMIDFLVDDAGRLWVRRPSADSLVRFDVLDPAHGLVASATTTLLLSTIPGQIVIRDDAVYAIVLDEMDVPYVIRARIRRER